MDKAKNIFLKFKKRFGGDVLFFRFGDYYEAFFDDAKHCSQVLGLLLTEREKDGELVPVVAIEFWLIKQCVEKMRKAGYSVSLCEQYAGGNIKRDVVRTYSAHTGQMGLK